MSRSEIVASRHHPKILMQHTQLTEVLISTDPRLTPSPGSNPRYPAKLPEPVWGRLVGLTLEGKQPK